MSHSSARSGRCGGFTLHEVLLAVTLSGILFAAIFGAYLFLGRNLARLVNFQQQEAQSRRTLRQFTDDVSTAISLNTATATSLEVLKPTAAGNVTVSYSYSAADGTLNRTDASGTRTMFSGITALALTYYNERGTVISPAPQSVKAIELSFSSAAGSATSGTLARYTVVSPRVVLRNKPALQ